MASLTLIRIYQQSFETHPNATLAFIGGALNALGDCFAQLSQNLLAIRNHEARSGYDIPRTLRFFAFGFTISPLLGRWNHFLERAFPLRSIKGSSRVSFRALGKRVAADQVIMAPLGLAIFIGSMGAMEGRDAKHILQRYADLYEPTVLANWKVWPVAQFVNFRYMPLPYRVPFQSTCGVFWTVYLSLVNSREAETRHR